MVSDSERESDRESVFADCHLASETDSASGIRKRQLSMPEMARQMQTKRAKRPSHGRSSRSPRDSARGHRPGPGGSSQPAGETAVTLEAIQRLIKAGNREVIAAFETKFAQLAKRLDVVESECMEKDLEIQRLNALLSAEKEEMTVLREQMEGIDNNRRQSSLIITCDDFGTRAQGEDIESRAIKALNDRFPDLRLSPADIQVAHRLQGNNKVIVKFTKRRVRDDIFERRFEMLRRRGSQQSGDRGRRSETNGREMAALYINESLIPSRQQIFNALLQAKRPENGAKIVSVFTRRGIVYCKTEKNGKNIHVRDQQHLEGLLGGAGRVPRREPGAARPPRVAPPPVGDRAGASPRESGVARPSCVAPSSAADTAGSSTALSAYGSGGGPEGRQAVEPAAARATAPQQPLPEPSGPFSAPDHGPAAETVTSEHPSAESG